MTLSRGGFGSDTTAGRLVRFLPELPLGLLLATAVCNGLAHLGTTTMPLQVGALMDGVSLTASHAGLFSLLEVGAYAVTMLLLSPVVNRFSPRELAIAGAGFVSCGGALLYFLPWSWASFALAACMGAGFGLMFSAIITAISTSGSPDRLYAASNGAALIVNFVIVSLLPLTTFVLRALGVFLGIAVAALLATAIMFGLPKEKVTVPADGQVAVGVFSRPGSLSLVLSWVCFSIGTGAVWAFAERVGKSAGIHPETIGLIFSSSIVSGVLGTIMAGLIAGSRRRIRMLGCGLAVYGLACVTIGTAHGITAFACGVALFWISYMYLYSLWLGTAAIVDPRGRLGTLGGGADRLAYAVGTGIGGLLVEYVGLSSIGWLGFVGSAIAIIFFLPAIGRGLEYRPLGSPG